MFSAGLTIKQSLSSIRIQSSSSILVRLVFGLEVDDDELSSVLVNDKARYENNCQINLLAQLNKVEIILKPNYSFLNEIRKR